MSVMPSMATESVRRNEPTRWAKSDREQTQQRACSALLDHLVGAREQRRRHVEAQRLGSLEVDHKLVFGRRLHRQVGRLLALEDAIDITGCAAVRVDRIGPIGNQPTGGEDRSGLE